MKYLILGTLLFLVGCNSIQVPDLYQYKEIQTSVYKLATWQKIMDNTKPVRIYIEGDGHAFNYAGLPTSNPTPHSTFLREIAFNDPNSNVVYLGRPCQYISDDKCSQTDWTTGRFSQQIIDSTYQAIKQISKEQPVILIGYSGGALLSGLVIEQYPNLPVKKWITIAGVLNHSKWTKDLNLPPLKDSVDLVNLPTVQQIHLVGDKDDTVSYKLTQSIVSSANLVIIPNATHNRGYKDYDNLIYDK